MENPSSNQNTDNPQPSQPPIQPPQAPPQEQPSTPPPQAPPQEQPPEMPPQQPPKEQPREGTSQKQKNMRLSAAVIAAILVVGLVGGGFIGYAVSNQSFNSKLTSIQNELNGHTANDTFNTYPNATYIYGYNASLSDLYAEVKSSVVVIQDIVTSQTFFIGEVESTQQGSGFITEVNNQLVIVTNDHVINGATNITVTTANGASYTGTVIGADPEADLAVLTINPMPSGLTPLTLVSSDTLQVGQPVVAVGSPYGLQGTLTTGVISAVGRTLAETESDESAGPTIPDTIQTSTAINPGNSGGPLLNYAGEVVGITTAAVSNSDGLGFAIPSATIMRELASLVSTGTYDDHPSLDVSGTDMSLQIAQAMGVNVTYGFLVESTQAQNGLKGGTTTSDIWGQQVTLGGDIIIGANGTAITNTDSLLAYLEENTLPGQTVNFTIVRNGQTQTMPVTIEKASSQ